MENLTTETEFITTQQVAVILDFPQNLFHFLYWKPCTGILPSHFQLNADLSCRCCINMRSNCCGVRPLVFSVSLYIYKIRMRSARDVYVMKEWKFRLMRKHFLYLEITILFNGFERCSYAIQFKYYSLINYGIPVMMEQHELLMS